MSVQRIPPDEPPAPRIEKGVAQATTGTERLFVAYLRAVKDDWVARMSGPASIILAFAAAYFEFIVKHGIAVLWMAAAACLVLTSYRIWSKVQRELIAERAQNAKPNIQGEIKEVFFDKYYSLMHSGVIDSEEFRHYYDFSFTVRVYVVNQGAATTIKGFRFVLRSNGNAKDGEKESLKDYYVERRENPYTLASAAGRVIQEDLGNIDDLNDQPLEHSRNGWLRFGIEGIPEIESDMEIEIRVIDKKGDSHPLNNLPQTQWQQNSQDNYPRIVYFTKHW